MPDVGLRGRLHENPHGHGLRIAAHTDAGAFFGNSGFEDAFWFPSNQAMLALLMVAEKGKPEALNPTS